MLSDVDQLVTCSHMHIRTQTRTARRPRERNTQQLEAHIRYAKVVQLGRNPPGPRQRAAPKREAQVARTIVQIRSLTGWFVARSGCPECALRECECVPRANAPSSCRCRHPSSFPAPGPRKVGSVFIRTAVVDAFGQLLLRNDGHANSRNADRCFPKSRTARSNSQDFWRIRAGFGRYLAECGRNRTNSAEFSQI